MEHPSIEVTEQLLTQRITRDIILNTNIYSKSSNDYTLLIVYFIISVEVSGAVEPSSSLEGGANSY